MLPHPEEQKACTHELDKSTRATPTSIVDAGEESVHSTSTCGNSWTFSLADKKHLRGQRCFRRKLRINKGQVKDYIIGETRVN